MNIGLRLHGQSKAEKCGRMLQSWREMHNLTIYAMSKATGLRKETINNLENGNGQIASLFTWLAAAKGLDSNRDYKTLVNAIMP